MVRGQPQEQRDQSGDDDGERPPRVSRTMGPIHGREATSTGIAIRIVPGAERHLNVV
jgi:hypothetical protein